MVPKYQWCGGFLQKSSFSFASWSLHFPSTSSTKKILLNQTKLHAHTHTHKHTRTHTHKTTYIYLYIQYEEMRREREREWERENERENWRIYRCSIYKHNRTLEYWTTRGGFKLRGFLRLQASSYGKCAIKIW